MKVFVFYDIKSNSRRSKLINTLRDYSLKRIQLSGFFGDIDKPDLKKLWTEMTTQLKKNEDCVLALSLCKTCFRAQKTFGDISFKDAEVVVV